MNMYLISAACVFGLASFVLLLAILRPRMRQVVIAFVAVTATGYGIYHKIANAPPPVEPSAFAKAVDLEPLNTMAVQHNGRVKSFSSIARTMMRYVTGSRSIAGQSQTFTYMDMLLRSDAYNNADVIYVKQKDFRNMLADHMVRDTDADPQVVASFRKTGLISPAILRHPAISTLLTRLEQDLMRTNKPVNAVRDALAVADPRTLLGQMRVIPPPGGRAKDQWYMLADAMTSPDMPTDSAHSGMRSPTSVPGLDPKLSGQLSDTWTSLASAWRAQDADAVNKAVTKLAALVRTVEPSLYPDLDKLQLESWYFRSKSMTWVWLIYAAAVVPLLMAVMFGWRWARFAGIFFFVIAFGFHTASLAIRWHISGRIPNANMFEAITAASWFGCLSTFVIEYLSRKTAMRNLFFLGAAVAAMAAAMCNRFMPTTLSSDIDNMMPILHDVWLYIHTNMIIWSYALIAMAAVTSGLYLWTRIGGGPPDAAVLGGAGSLIMHDHPKSSFVRSGAVSFAQVYDGATMVLMELSFVTLWTGLVMGAIWADHSWGRPWGWDPKEVFALNTFIVFLLLVHVRIKVRDKGLWTAIFALVGCGVMLFNWIVINFIITGLHSYA
jgi:cytochrome c-type biogenesis protein CcsB